jgi:hypothetical protein
MARTNIPVDALVGNGGVAQTAPTAVDQPNGMNVQVASLAGRSSRVMFLVHNADATHALTVKVDAGAQYPAGAAFRALENDIVVPASGNFWLGPFESAEVGQADQSINLDFLVATGGSYAGSTIAAFQEASV